MNVSSGVALRRRLAVVVVAAGLAVAGCGGTARNAPGTPASPSVVSSPPPTRAPATPSSWAKSMCQALGLAFIQLGTPPEPDFDNPAATRQAYIDFLGRAANVTQQAIDQLSFLGPPPVPNGQQIFDRVRTHLTQLHNNFDDAVTQLKVAKPDALAGIGPTLGAAGNAIGLIGVLTSDPQLHAAFDQTPECRSLSR